MALHVSDTAHYTGHVWIRHDGSDPAFGSPKGAFLYWAIHALRLAPWLDDWLLTRHRWIDRELIAAIDKGAVSQVVELAAGLSPRGWRFRKLYGSSITYVETDLPAMVQHKRKIIDRLGGETPCHYLRVVNVLASEGPDSLESLCSGLDPARGVAIVSEGLLLYLDKPDVLNLWRRIAGVLSRFPQGRYFADISPLSWPDAGAGALLQSALGLFVRSRVHGHYTRASDVADDLGRCGLLGEVLDVGHGGIITVEA